MRFIPTLTHGSLDYLIGMFLIVVPWAVRLNEPETWFMDVFGLAVIGYSLFTDYELALVRWIPVPVHLGLDIAAGVVMAAVPWLFSFAGDQSAFHVAIGLLLIVVALMTELVPSETGEVRGAGYSPWRS
jgi:hypothetical protein